jgi:SET domain-containing protein
MLVVPTFIAQSPIQGTGLYAAEAIPKGALIWQFQAGFDAVLDASFIASLPPVARAFVERYSIVSPLFPGSIILHGDNTRFINHATDPNTDNDSDPERTFALRDIAKGEEITADYKDCCDLYRANPEWG